jgi:SAM-dependent methyltransferase
LKVEDVASSRDRTLSPPYVRYLIRLIRPFPNFDFFFIKSLRERAVAGLQLKPGDRVLDVGCGPGGSFPYLVDAVGESGQVVGVEISPGAAKHANLRIAANGWTNVQVITADASKVELHGRFDALLMFAAPDAYASPQVLANLWPYLKDDARVAAFGAKLSHGSLGKPFNSLFRWMVSKATFPSTPKLDYEPWKMLECRAGPLHVEEYCLRRMFLAFGPTESSNRSLGHS